MAASRHKREATADYFNLPATIEADETNAGSRLSFARIDPRSATIDGYSIDGMIDDSGGQANVYRAYKDHKVFALKLFHRAFEPNLSVTQILKSGECPYVSRLIDNGYYEQNFYYEVYDYFEQGSLVDYVRNHPSDIRFIEDTLVPSVDQALNYIHSKNLIHGDVKPSNIFIKGDSVILGDFGVAGSKMPKGAYAKFRGTPEYAPAAPMNNGLWEIGSAYDYGSFGLVLLFAFTGISPLAGKTSEERSEWLLHPVIPQKSLPGNLRRLITGLLERDSLRRFGHFECRDFYTAKALNENRGRRNSCRGRSHHANVQKMQLGVSSGHIVDVANLKEMYLACEDNWNIALNAVGSYDLDRFLNDVEGGSDLLEKWIVPFKLAKSNIRAFCLCNGLRHIFTNGEGKTLVYDDIRYENILELLEKASAGESSSLPELFKGESLPLYLLEYGYGQSAVDEAREVLASFSVAKTAAASLLKIIRKDSGLSSKAWECDSVNELLVKIMETSWDDIRKIACSDEIEPWLYQHKLTSVCAEMEEIDEW